jgi:hypothetical protein
MNTPTLHWIGWTALMALTGLATAWLHGYADPLIPPGEWHGSLSGLFIVVIWPSLMWLLWSMVNAGQRRG